MNVALEDVGSVSVCVSSMFIVCYLISKDDIFGSIFGSKGCELHAAMCSFKEWYDVYVYEPTRLPLM